MTDHDSLCRRHPESTARTCDECQWIAKVRAEEREKIAQAIEAAPVPEATNPLFVARVTAARIARNGGSDE